MRELKKIMWGQPVLIAMILFPATNLTRPSYLTLEPVLVPRKRNGQPQGPKDRAFASSQFEWQNSRGTNGRAVGPMPFICDHLEAGCAIADHRVGLGEARRSTATKSHEETRREGRPTSCPFAGLRGDRRFASRFGHVASVVAAADEWTAGNLLEAHLAGHLAQFVELLRRYEANHR